MKEQNRNMSREELEKIWCKNNANVPRMESEYPATPEEAIMLNGKDVMKALKQYEVPTGSVNVWDLPEGYEFRDENGNVINAKKIVLEKKKPKYTKNIFKCTEILGIRVADQRIEGYKEEALGALQTLLIYRDAYWKIAGDEMGLGKPWSPDFRGVKTCYVITVESNKILKSWTTKKQVILAFPTEEMRDAFYENFKEEIESCKELL